MKISVAMATYNGERFIREQLESFSAQTRLPDELIVSDDGSTDSTLDIVAGFARTAPFPLNVHRNADTLGYAGNFDVAISRCTGDLIFLSDQDDVWCADKIERIEKIFLDEPDVWVTINDAEITDSELRQTGIRKCERLKSLGFSSESFIPGCCTALRREMVSWIAPVPYQDGVFVHDAWIHQLGILLAVRRFVPGVLQYYRRHGDNTSTWVGSRPHSVTRVDFFKSIWPQDSHAYCVLRRRQLKALMSRLRDRVRMPSSLPDLHQRVTTVLVKLKAEQRAVERRLIVLEKNGWARIPSAAVMFVKGDYSYFSSWKSLVKDVVTGLTR